MKRFSGVVLREGYGWVSVRDAIVAAPPDVAAFGVIERARNAGIYGFVVVDTPLAVAVLADENGPLPPTADREKAIGLLLRGGHPVVVWTGEQADEGRCFGERPDAVEEAACAVFASRTLGRGVESGVMTIRLTSAGDASSVRVSGRYVDGSWEIEVAR